jgi:type III pantothenate kinase
MNQLLIDIGNTRVKWAVRRRDRLGRMQALPLSGDGSAALRQVAAAAVRAKVTDILAVSVAGIARERSLRRCFKAAGLPVPQLITSQAVAAGVRNGYREIWKLGADRWVAVVGAGHEAGRGCAGEALTKRPWRKYPPNRPLRVSHAQNICNTLSNRCDNATGLPQQ